MDAGSSGSGPPEGGPPGAGLPDGGVGDTARTTVVRTGRGDPITVFAPGAGETIPGTRVWGSGVAGTRVFFGYGESGYVDRDAAGRADGDPVTQADLDAAELRAVADAHGATRALGASRGARAVLGVLAADRRRFERAVLLLPPGGHADGRFTEVLTRRDVPVRAKLLVIGQRDDPIHPESVAREWAERLGARLELFEPGGLPVAHRRRLRAVITEFLSPT